MLPTGMPSRRPCSNWQIVSAWRFASRTTPPYCSKHNPIERRLLNHVTRACQGVTFHTVDIARQLMAKAKTATGLNVTVVLGGVYVTVKKVAADFLENMRINFDEHLPRWNYRATPAIR